ncbi:unnamed protein product [Lactuca saligna]|uniref:Uncharacterized protein n=2 Tax=Lactuca TaxID=4235 RepID=A0AA35Y9U5_LACSI|nr:unnamed protein product [Lactuca saligna]
MAFNLHHSRHFITLSYLFLLLCSCFSSIFCSSDNDFPPVTPINRDLYRTSDALMEEIEALVNRHQDRLHMETFQSTNKGYHAELNVVTYCRNRTAIEDKSKFRILLMITCLPEFWAACTGAYYNRACIKDPLHLK